MGFLSSVVDGMVGIYRDKINNDELRHKQMEDERFQLRMRDEDREYNTPLAQLQRMKQAGINTFTGDYTATNDSSAVGSVDFGQYIPQHSPLPSASEAVSQMLAFRDANDTHDLKEGAKSLTKAELFREETLNKVLGRREEAEISNLEADTQNKKADTEGKKEGTKLTRENVRTQQLFNEKYGDLLEAELNLKKGQGSRIQQDIEMHKYAVLGNQVAYLQAIRNPQEFYRRIERELDYEDKSKFYALESYRINHLLELIQEDLEPQTRQAMEAQLAYTIAHSNQLAADAEFNDSDVKRWTRFGLEIVNGVVNAASTVTRMGVHRNLSRSSRFGNYSETSFDGNGEITGGKTHVFER